MTNESITLQQLVLRQFHTGVHIRDKFYNGSVLPLNLTTDFVFVQESHQVRDLEMMIKSSGAAKSVVLGKQLPFLSEMQPTMILKNVFGGVIKERYFRLVESGLYDNWNRRYDSLVTVEQMEHLRYVARNSILGTPGYNESNMLQHPFGRYVKKRNHFVQLFNDYSGRSVDLSIETEPEMLKFESMSVVFVALGAFGWIGVFVFLVELV